MTRPKLGEFGDQPFSEYATNLQKPTSIVVKVESLRLNDYRSGADMEITAEFSNGQRRSGRTARDGMLGFLQRSDGDWAGAVVRRVSVGYPRAGVAPVWFDIPNARVKSLTVLFEPGRMASVVFERASFSIVMYPSADLAPRLVQMSGSGPGRLGWEFVQRRQGP